MDKQPKVFVIVVTYKGMRWYDKCFSSLRESTLPVQTIVVDNTPGEDDANYIREHYPEIIVIKTPENLGFGRANNIGMRYALENGGDYVFLLNQDAWIELDTLKILTEISEMHPEYGILSPLHLNIDGIHVNMGIISDDNNFKLFSDAYAGTIQPIYEMEYINAAGWLLPRKTLETVGGFCPLIYHYGEDDDYINRVHFHNLKIGLCPIARMTHDHQIPVGLALSFLNSSNLLTIHRYINPNDNDVISSFKKYYLRKVVVCLFSLSFADFKRFGRLLVFIFKNKKQMEYCITQHKNNQPTWLTDNQKYLHPIVEL